MVAHAGVLDEEVVRRKKSTPDARLNAARERLIEQDYDDKSGAEDCASWSDKIKGVLGSDDSCEVHLLGTPYPR